MYPHERSLVATLQNRPFVLLGVNSDPEQEMLQHTISRQHMTWRSWWDGQGGPIVSQWGVHCWPTVYLLDNNGVVRYRFGVVSPEELEVAIGTLLHEMETQNVSVPSRYQLTQQDSAREAPQPSREAGKQ